MQPQVISVVPGSIGDLQDMRVVALHAWLLFHANELPEESDQLIGPSDES